MALFEKCLENGWIDDGAISQSEVQAKTFWRYREDISESLSARLRVADKAYFTGKQIATTDGKVTLSEA